jgi:hypothetical protein
MTGLSGYSYGSQLRSSGDEGQCKICVQRDQRREWAKAPVLPLPVSARHHSHATRHLQVIYAPLCKRPNNGMLHIDELSSQLGSRCKIQIYAHQVNEWGGWSECPGPDRNSRSYKEGKNSQSNAQSPSGMPRQARLHFLSLKSSLVNLPVSLFGPLLERNIASPSFSSHPLHTNHIVLRSLSVHNMLLSYSQLSYHLSSWMERKLMHMSGGQAWFLLHP